MIDSLGGIPYYTATAFETLFALYNSMETEKYKKWAPVLLWSSSIALAIFLLMWVRLRLDLTPTQDEMFFYLPHFLILIWGIIAGLSIRDAQTRQSTPIQYPFLSIFFVMLFFDIIFLFWASVADRHLGIISSNPQLFSSFLQAAFPSLLFLAYWTLIPFFIGCFPAKIVRYISDLIQVRKNGFD